MSSGQNGTRSSASFNEARHDEFWTSCADFSRYNPGARHRRRVILGMLGDLRFQSVLDVGCGDGELLGALRESFPARSYHGLDLSSETVRNDAVRHPWCTFSVLNIEEGSLARTFDLVVCSEVMEHLDDRAAGARNLAAMVAPGGHLVVTTPTGKVYATERHFGHVSHPRPDELSRELVDAGLDVVALTNWGFPLYTAMKYATNLRTPWALETFASGPYSRGVKLLCDALYWLHFSNLQQSSLGCQLFALARRPG